MRTFKEDGGATTLTGFSGCSMAIYSGPGNRWNTNGEGVAFGVQAITYKHEKQHGKIAGSLVLYWNPNPIEGPHHLIIESVLDDRVTFGVKVVYGIILLDTETGEEVSWLDAELAKAYNFLADGHTGWIHNQKE